MKRLNRPSAVRSEVLECLQPTCPLCGGPTWRQYTNRRQVVTLEGVIELRLRIQQCRTPTCPRYRKPYRPESEGRYSLPQHEFGLDVIAEIGRLRYQEQCSVPAIHQRLRARDLPMSERSVTNLLDRYDELVALQMSDPTRLRAATHAAGKVVLALDGLQPTVGNEVLWVVRDCLSGTILLARSLLSATADDLAPLLRQVQAALDVPIVGIISDGQQSVRNAIAQALPGIPHQLCQFHYLKEAAPPVYEADRHAKKELKKRVRGVRPIERAVAEQDDPTATLVRGYAVAIRSALSDDGPAPLAAPGIRLQERLTHIAASMQAMEEKGGPTAD
jgi:hypothetical protein